MTMFQAIMRAFTGIASPPEPADCPQHVRAPSLIAVMMQLGTLVALHRAKPDYCEIDILVHDGDAMRSIIAHINDTWAYKLGAPAEFAQGLASTGGIVQVETDQDTQRAQIAGIYIHWPAPGIEFESIVR